MRLQREMVILAYDWLECVGIMLTRIISLVPLTQKKKPQKNKRKDEKHRLNHNNTIQNWLYSVEQREHILDVKSLLIPIFNSMFLLDIRNSITFLNFFFTTFAICKGILYRLVERTFG